MDVKVMLGNYDRYVAQQHLIKGVGKTADALILEISSPSGKRKYRYLVSITLDAATITHKCKAAENGRPCWHMAAALDALSRFKDYKQSYPVTVNSIAEAPEAEEVEDITQQVFSKPGDFRLLNATNITEKDEVGDINETETDKTESTETDELCGYIFPTPLLEKILAFRERQKEILTEDQLKRVPGPTGYIPIEDELIRTIRALLAGRDSLAWRPALLIGHKSTGKSTLAATAAHILMLPTTLIGGNDEVSADWLIGGPTITYDEEGRQQIVHQPGLLLQAVQNGELLIFEELNMVKGDITSMMHPLLDQNRVLPVPGLGSIKPHPSFRMIACVNPPEYAGTKQMNDAFKSRFLCIRVPYPPKSTVEEVIVRQTGIKRDIARIYAEVFKKIAKRAENNDISHEAASIRALINAAEEVIDLKKDPKDALIKCVCDSIMDDKYTVSVVEEIIDSMFA